MCMKPCSNHFSSKLGSGFETETLRLEVCRRPTNKFACRDPADAPPLSPTHSLSMATLTALPEELWIKLVDDSLKLCVKLAATNKVICTNLETASAGRELRLVVGNPWDALRIEKSMSGRFHIGRLFINWKNNSRHWPMTAFMINEYAIHITRLKVVELDPYLAGRIKAIHGPEPRTYDQEMERRALLDATFTITTRNVKKVKLKHVKLKQIRLDQMARWEPVKKWLEDWDMIAPFAPVPFFPYGMITPPPISRV